jgi:hypothetical protein
MLPKQKESFYQFNRIVWFDDAEIVEWYFAKRANEEGYMELIPYYDVDNGEEEAEIVAIAMKAINR